MAIETFTYTTNFFDIEANAESQDPSINAFIWKGGGFNSDGTKLFVISSETDGSLFEYALSTPYKPHTATFTAFVSNETLLTNDPPFDSFPTNTGGFMSPDGTFMSLSAHDGTAFWGIKITFGTPFDITTAAFNPADTEDLSAELGNSSSRVLLNHADGGTRVFFIADTASQILECPLSTPYDILTIGAATTHSIPNGPEAVNTVSGLAVTDDGLTAFISYLPGTFDKTIIAEYSMSPAFDFSTLSYTGNFIQDTDAAGETIGSFASSPNLFFRRDNLSSLFWMGFDQFETASFNETIFEYSGAVEPPCRLQAQFGFLTGGVARKLFQNISGLHHFNPVQGECTEVTAWVDGSPAVIEVCDGDTSLTRLAALVHIGFPYVTEIETLNPEVGSGTIQGQKVSIPSVTLRFHRSLMPLVGPNFDRLTPIKLREEENLGDPTALFTGDKEQVIEADWNSNGRIAIRHGIPGPLTILAIIPDIIVEDETDGG